MKIFLDIDGVLLRKDHTPANHVAEFLEFMTNNHECYWLTTHCKGDINTAVSYLEQELGKDYLKYLNKIRPTNWNTWKTEAIDFDSDFVWLDDFAFDIEKKELERNNKLDSLITIDLDKNPNQLKQVISQLQ